MMCGCCVLALIGVQRFIWTGPGHLRGDL
jgi:hypothetical protein